MRNQIIQGDCLEVMRELPDNSVDAIITDPPYGIGLAEWDSEIDVAFFSAETQRIVKSFYCFFGQMPTVTEWINAAANTGMPFREHISWIKRSGGVSCRLSRAHESIFIYGWDSKFHQTKGRYEDVKIPGILFDVITIEGFRRNYQEAISLLKGKTLKKRISSQTRQKEFKRYGVKTFDRAKEFVNYTNVWSFLPPTKAAGRVSKSVFRHPCEKPLEIMKRLVEMLAPPGGLVLDPFAGSGTTAIACLETGRDYLCIEQSEEYIATIHQRIDKWHRDNGHRHTLEERVQWLETQIQAQGNKIKKMEGDRQMSIFDVLP